MSFDGMMTRAVVHECQSLKSGRITKIYQPGQTEITWMIRSKGKNILLLFSAHPVYARVQQIDKNWDNPAEPPMFCRVLRKHLEGGIIEDVRQVGMERIIYFDIRHKNEWGDWSKRRFIIELMGRHSNLILINPETETIYDAIKRIPHHISSYRQVLPNESYLAPPDQGKLSPLTIDHSSFIASFDYNGGQLDKQMVQRFSGIGPLFAKEVIFRAGIGSRDHLWTAFHDMIEQIKTHQYQPMIVRQRNGKEVFSSYPLTHLTGEVQKFESVSQCLSAYFSGKAERDRTKQQAGDLLRRVTQEIEKNKKKIRLFEQEAKQIQQAEKWRTYGELTIANLHQMKRGMDKITVVNYFDPNGSNLTLPLDPRLHPNENAQRFFKRYQKLRDAQKWNKEQKEKALEEIDYLESVLMELEQASLVELEQIREELVEEGYLKRQERKQKRQRNEKPVPLSLKASDGTLIWLGKNNKQNDYLTHKLASSHYIWLHTKDIPGSHVVIQSSEPSEQTLIEAAMLAAFHSKAHASSQVPVDYTRIKYVKKPVGSRPGFVTYTHQKTLYITPKQDVIKQILDK
ncbi:Predicted component of the ribosome quality control (RQC) complex, YloA/Tae2 family, contains fibronectin-binding (FbpA) and DUF814 domains [Seinonella peptonophila]|uniref:Rqc2 homolog RqcH n=1 Tax=Seinonella peptonophila TaxID=112248 RepID=A0A1M4UXF9_9BACL|nr:NFACT RNA binding domain-containing protein [Seinonella peptonophila]SHE61349.1 Predicted component of the ribosome quality control (RQC) complex, YloA/Tae2 family, contains fibronectin-binding (FbpA) and DUF814 domains [Seinonella peptonophila]